MVSLNPNQILTKELSPDMKQWEELIRENVFGLGGHRDHLPACLAHMLYCVVAEEQYNLAYFFVKRIQCARATPTVNLPYGMFLTLMLPLVLKQTRRPRSDRGKARHSVSSSSSNHQGTSSHQHDDDDDDVETSRAKLPSPKPPRDQKPTSFHQTISPINSHVTHTQASSQSDNQTPYIKDTPTSQQVVSHPPLPISPINSHETHTQVPPQSDNQTQHTSPPSPSRESLVDDINQLQDLSNLLAMHLSQQQNNIPSSPYSPNLPHTLNMNQVETHVGYCPCCIFTQKQFLALSEDINWIEFLLTRPHPPLRVQRDYPSTTASAPNSPSTTN
ncbi:hypothetical protein Tco_0054364 [Tanacetum coccineum]